MAQFLILTALLAAEMSLAKVELNQNYSLDNIQTKVLQAKYPLYFKLLRLALTFPIGSVKCERSISVLRRVHNFCRTTMLQDRLSDLSLLAIESDVLANIPTSTFDEIFSNDRSRRIMLV